MCVCVCVCVDIGILCSVLCSTTWCIRMHSMCVMGSSQSEGDANADGVIIFSIGTTQPTIIEKLKPPTKLDLACEH